MPTKSTTLERNCRRRNLTRLRRILDVAALWDPGAIVCTMQIVPLEHPDLSLGVFLEIVDRPATHQVILRLRQEVYPSSVRLTTPAEAEFMVDVLRAEVVALGYRCPSQQFTFGAGADADSVLAGALRRLRMHGVYLGRASVVSIAA